MITLKLKWIKWKKQFGLEINNNGLPMVVVVHLMLLPVDWFKSC